MRADLAWGSVGPGRALSRGSGLAQACGPLTPHNPAHPAGLGQGLRTRPGARSARPRFVEGWERVLAGFSGPSAGLSTGSGLSSLSWSSEAGKSPAGLAGPAASSAWRQHRAKPPLSARSGALSAAPRPPLPAQHRPWHRRDGPAAARGGEEGCLCVFVLLLLPSHPRVSL